MSKTHYLYGVAAAVMAAATSAAAVAQTAPPAAPTPPADAAAASQAGLGDIVVTARKTTENLQKAPASIVVASGSQLQAMGITNTQLLQLVLPSASLHTDGPVTQTFIRGIGTRVDSMNFAASSIILFNGIVVPRFGSGGLLFDLANVQEIAGPQGTLYGGSAAGGAINFNSAQPRNDYGGDVLVEGGDYDEAHVAMDQNLPLGDKVSVRGAVDYESHGGYESYGIDGLNRIEGRVSVLAKPTDDLTMLVFFNGFQNTGKPPATVNTIPPRFPNNPWQLPPTLPSGVPVNSAYTNQNNQAYILGANINWRLGDNLFTYIPGGVSVVSDNGPYYFGGSGALLKIRDREEQHSEELRWSRRFNALQMSAGFFYLNDHSNVNEDEGIPTFKTPPFWVFEDNLVHEITTDTTYAVFAQGIYSFTDQLRLTVGARDSYDQISANGFSSAKPFVFSGSENHPDWKVGLDYDVTPRILVYANVQTGYIPFGYNPDATSTSPITKATTVPLSSLLAYSGGFKSRFLDNHLQVNSELYYYDYTNFQAIAFITATAKDTILNAKKAVIYGADTDVALVLPYNTKFDTDFVLESAHYTQFSGVGYNYSGNEMVDAPPVTVDASLTHIQSLGSIGDLTGLVDVHYDGGHYGNFNNFPNGRQAPFARVNLALTYTPPSARWHLEAYVNNITDAVEYGSPSPGSTRTAVGTGLLVAPRTVGLRFTAHWN